MWRRPYSRTNWLPLSSILLHCFPTCERVQPLMRVPLCALDSNSASLQTQTHCPAFPSSST